ncbi:hypothetical protein RQP46_009053 [Phenoliferia psychrophenolica]
MRFPPEVISLIVEQIRLSIRSDSELANDARVIGAVNASTLACALVSREWADATIPHLLFPHLHFNHSPSTFHSLLAALAKNAWCLPLVRRVDARQVDCEEWALRRRDGLKGEDLRIRWRDKRRGNEVEATVNRSLEGEVREEWRMAIAEELPETPWSTTLKEIETQSGALYALIGHFPTLEHLGVTDFHQGPSPSLGLAPSPTDAVLANLKSLAILDQPLTSHPLYNTCKHWEQLLSATPSIETLVLPGSDSPDWTDRHNPPQLPLLRHLTTHSLTQPILDLLFYSSAKLDTLIFRNSLDGIRGPGAALAAVLQSHPSLRTLELPSRRPIDTQDPYRKFEGLPLRSGRLIGVRRRARDLSDRWSGDDDDPIDPLLLHALLASSLRHIIINDPVTLDLVHHLPPTLETLEYRIRTREPDDLDEMVDWIVQAKLPVLRKVVNRGMEGSWRTFGPGSDKSFAQVPHGGVEEEQRRADARVAKAASVGIVLEVPLIVP